MDRVKLLHRHSEEQRAALKDLKRKKGALRDAAQVKYDELLSRHQAELEEFERTNAATATTTAAQPSTTTSSAATTSSATKPASSAVTSTPAVDPATTKFPVLKWGDLSRTELAEECVKRGLGKKGSKEELTTRLVIFSQEQAKMKFPAPAKVSKPAAATGAAATPSKPAASTPPPSASAAKSDSKPVKKSEESEDDDSEEGSDDSEDDDSDESDELTEEEKAELERQHKRKNLLLLTISDLLKTHSSGISLDDLPDILIAAGVLRDKANLAPEKFGYKSLAEMFKAQPRQILVFDSASNRILPPAGKQNPTTATPTSTSASTTPAPAVAPPTTSASTSTSTSASASASTSTSTSASAATSAPTGSRKKKGRGH
ncbi:hypothetical protein Pelo_11334 [Pelomyxa schiedti]|nr:hypothetical protein Pelo_11334 [Pelomyxa schiedti]